MALHLKLKNYLTSFVSYGTQKHCNDNELWQKVQCEFFDGLATIPRVQNYGLSSNPPKDSQVLAVCNGERKKLIAIAVQGQKRPHGLSEGSVALHNDKIELLLDGDIAKFTTDKVLIGNIDVLQTIGEFLDYLIKQAPLSPDKILKDPTDLIKIKTKLLKNGSL